MHCQIASGPVNLVVTVNVAVLAMTGFNVNCAHAGVDIGAGERVGVGVDVDVATPGRS